MSIISTSLCDLGVYGAYLRLASSRLKLFNHVSSAVLKHGWVTLTCRSHVTRTRGVLASFEDEFVQNALCA